MCVVYLKKKHSQEMHYQLTHPQVTFQSSLTIQSNARQKNILTNWGTSLGVYSDLNGKLIADWSVAYINPDVIRYLIMKSLDLSVSSKKIKSKLLTGKRISKFII